MLRNVASVLLLGTREPLRAVAEAYTSAQQCTVVAWTLQISLGLVLSTLLLWRQQLWAARKETQRRQQLWEAQLTRQQPDDLAAVRDAVVRDYRRSQYARVCTPVIAAAGTFGTWVVPVLGVALAGFVGATLAFVGGRRQLMLYLCSFFSSPSQASLPAQSTFLSFLGPTRFSTSQIASIHRHEQACSTIALLTPSHQGCLQSLI